MNIKKLSLISCLWFIAITSLFSQNADSLQLELSKAKEDTHKVNVLLKLANNLFDTESVKAREFAQEAQKLSEKLNYSHGLSNSLELIGALLYANGDYSNALKYLFNAWNAIHDDTSNLKDLSRIHIDMGNVYLRQADYAHATEYYLKASKNLERIGDNRSNGIVLMSLGLVNRKQNFFPQALEYNGKALKLFESISDWKSQIKVKNNIAAIYLEQQRNNEALEISLQSLALSEKYGTKHQIENSYSFIGLSYFQLKNYSKAIEYYNMALQIEEDLNDQFSIAISMANIAKVYLETKEFDKSIQHFHRALLIFKDKHMKDEVKDVYKDLSDVYEKQNNFQKAMEYYKQYATLKDSVFNEKNSKKINELYAKYESEQKEKKIALLNAEILSKQKDKELLGSQVEKRNSVIFGTVIGALLLIVSIFLFFSRQQLKQKNKYQSEINKQQENTAIAIIQAQENERNRISRDLHDGMGTFLSTLKINLENFESSIPAEKIEKYKSTSQLVDKTAAELRSIMKNLSSETLQENGLEGALQELVESVNRLGLTRFNFLSHGLTKRLDTIIEINLYRVAQELLNNCLKHAQATQATLQLIDHENAVLLMIEDNGGGFDTHNSKQDNNYGMGFKNIHNRINFIKGSVKIESVPGKGSTFIIEVPKSLA